MTRFRAWLPSQTHSQSLPVTETLFCRRYAEHRRQTKTAEVTTTLFKHYMWPNDIANPEGKVIKAFKSGEMDDCIGGL